LLPQLDPWFRVFLRNFTDLFKASPSQDYPVTPGVFWADVFVPSPLPWRRFAQSGITHVLAVGLICLGGRLWPQLGNSVQPAAVKSEDVIYFSPSEYLPALSSGGDTPAPREGDPAFATQPILSVPANPDNRTQSIVTPPDVKLQAEVQVPNIVAWQEVSPTVPLAATERVLPTNQTPLLQPAVIAPAPEVAVRLSRPATSFPSQVVAPAPDVKATGELRSSEVLDQTVVGPPPKLSPEAIHRTGAIDIGHAEAVAPAPKLILSERQAPRLIGHAAGTSESAVIAPPPSTAGIARPNTAGRLIALGVHPASLVAPVAAPSGNRRGTFGAGPDGKSDASGSPTINSGNGKSGAGSSTRVSNIPSGLSVGATPAETASATAYPGTALSTASPEEASLRAPDLARPNGPSGRGASEVPDEKVTEVDRQVFGTRKFYSMSLNMPNLNSSGGSWVIRFAELTADNNHGELTAPYATQKVDPAYPLALMRENVRGTVTVRAVIRRDGSVGDVRVVRSIDERLDAYACQALARWHFQPATKNGVPVDLDAVVSIPFRPSRLQSNF